MLYLSNANNMKFLLFPHCHFRDAMRVAEEAEEEILKVASDVIRVSILLRLGQPIPELHQRLQECNTEKSQNTHP